MCTVDCVYALQFVVCSIWRNFPRSRCLYCNPPPPFGKGWWGVEIWRGWTLNRGYMGQYVNWGGEYRLLTVNTKYVYEAVFCRFASICFSFHVSRVKSELHPANSTWIRPEPDSWKERQITEISNQFYFIIMHTMLKEENNNCCFNIINTFTNQTNTTFQFNFIQVIQYRYRY